MSMGNFRVLSCPEAICGRSKTAVCIVSIVRTYVDPSGTYLCTYPIFGRSRGMDGVLLRIPTPTTGIGQGLLGQQE
jgi:hypothetical protein